LVLLVVSLETGDVFVGWVLFKGISFQWEFPEPGSSVPREALLFSPTQWDPSASSTSAYASVAEVEGSPRSGHVLLAGKAQADACARWVYAWQGFIIRRFPLLSNATVILRERMRTHVSSREPKDLMVLGLCVLKAILFKVSSQGGVRQDYRLWRWLCREW